MKHMAVICVLALVAAPAAADVTYDGAMDAMLLIKAPDLTDVQSRAAAACYLDEMSAEHLETLSATQDPNVIFEVLMVSPMSAVDCENAVVSEALGEEFTRP